MSIKKCVNGSFVNDVYKEYGTDTDTITSFPKQIIGDGQNISAYSIKGNMTQNEVCGDKTANLLDNILVSTTYDGVTITLNSDKSVTVNGTLATTSQAYFKIGTIMFKSGENYTISGVTGYTSITMQMFTESNTAFPRGNRLQCFDGAVTRTALGDENCDVNLYIYAGAVFDNVKVYPFVCKGSIALPYQPYGYKIPISLSQNTYNIYITEPLRKSLDGNNLYDTIESNGTLTRRVDENGDALANPTTTLITVPTLPTTGTAENFDISTTLKPSEVSLTYHGWHGHSDTKF